MDKHPPSLEDAVHRDASLGYDPPSDVSRMLRCVSHGTPSPLIRWHYHEEYELHLVVATSGKMFVGDYIGTFEPGNLVLTGPRLPHNWISTDVPPEGVALRDRCIVFSRAPIDHCSDAIPELKSLRPLLDRARQGVEFHGMSDLAASCYDRIERSENLARLGAFFELLELLSRSTDYRLLSSVASQRMGDDRSMADIDKIVNHISERYAEPLSLGSVARHFKMSDSHFSRFFRRGTGNSFTDFLIRVRLTRACQLLMQTDRSISTICYDVGFQNIANFNRRFLDVKGTTPSGFRQQARSCFG